MQKDKEALVKKTLENDWVYNALSKAEQFRLLGFEKVVTHSREDKKDGIDEYLAEKSDWSMKAQKYLSMQIQSNKIGLNFWAAAKLAVSKSDAEKKLITAIELARSGYIICSLAAILQVIEQEDLGREDRLSSWIPVMENIATNTYIFSRQTNTVEGSQEWLYLAKQAQVFAEACCLTVDLCQSPKKLNDLIEKLKSLINLADTKVALKLHKQEKRALNVALERRNTTEKILESHQKPIVRSIHHLACTGGTLICKCLASMHDVALISEVNPLNRYDGTFVPTNPLLLLERGHREFTNQERIDIFKEQITLAHDICRKDDVDLILRDHSHTDFHCGSKDSDEFAILDHLGDYYDLVSIVSVRHPLDSYLSLINQGWDTYEPKGLNEYSRRYLAFVEKYSSLEMIRYEDFCEDPPKVMKRICRILKISYNKDFLNTFGSRRLSGDSGRTGLESIEKRSRRPIPEEVEQQLENSEYYFKLIKRLGY